MGQYRTQLEALFVDWKKNAEEGHASDTFIADGTLGEEEYARSKPRILFLNKEPYWGKNDPSGKYRSLSELVKPWTEPKYQMWKRLAALVVLIRVMESRPTTSWTIESVLTPVSPQEYLKSLKSAAFANIRKYGGEPRSGYATLKSHVQRHWKGILDEINILEPNIIVCGGTFNLLKEAPDFVDEPIADGIHRWRNITLINFWHPSSRMSNSTFYGRFVEIYKGTMVGKTG